MRPPRSETVPPRIFVYPARSGPPGGVRFSRTELFQLGIAVLALSLALTLLYSRGLLFGRIDSSSAVLFVGIAFASSLIAVATGVGLHEIAHKAVAQRYGHWAEFRYNPMGLVLAFLFALAGFIYGAPGATWISGYVTREQNGRISAAGPLTNIVLALGFFGLGAALSLAAMNGSLLFGIVAFIVANAAFLNVILAGFNMLPIMPLDGAKVWAWNKSVYFLIAGIVIVLLAVGFLAGLFPF